MKIHLKPGEAVKLELKSKEKLKIITPLGGQVADMTFLSFSQSLTRNFNRTVKLEENMILYDNNCNGILKLTKKKTDSNIDLLFPGCFKEIYKDHRPGCRDMLSKVFNVKRSELPDVVSFFMDVKVSENGKLEILPSSARGGDYVVLECLRDVVVGVTCCPDDLVACPNPSEIIVEVAK